MHAPASLPKLYTVAEALLLWPEGARPTAKRFKALARQLGACRICGRSMTFTDCDLATIVEAMRCSRLQREPNSPYWYIRGRVAGHPIHESTRTTDRRKAEAYRRKREAEIYDAAALGRKPAGTWGQAVNCYLDHGKSPRFLLPLVDLWGDKSLDKIDQARSIASPRRFIRMSVMPP